MATTKDDPSPLVAAAQTLESELRRFAELGDSLRREPFATQKSIDRGAQTLRQIGECETRLGQALTELVQAIGQVRDRQSSQAESINVRAKELEERGLVLRELLARYETLGGIAAQVSGALQELPKKSGEGNGADMASALPQLIESVARAGDAARALASDAEAKGFPDVGRNAETLRQQILGAQNKMKLLLEKLRPGASDPPPA